MEAVSVAIGVVQGGAALGLLFLVPGLTLGPLLLPGATTPLGRAARAIGVSMLVGAVAACGLAMVGLFRPTILLATLIGLTVLPLHASLPSRPSLPRGRLRRWWLAAATVTCLAVLVLVVPGWLAANGTVAAAHWEDVAVARHIALDGRLPAGLTWWGGLRPSPTGHVLVDAHLAGALALLPGDLPIQLETYRLAVLAAGLVAAATLLRRWTSSLLGLLGALLLLGGVAVGRLFGAFDPAAWATVMAVFAVWLADRALVERSRRIAAVSAAAGAAVLLAEAGVFAVFAALVIGVAVGRSLVAPGGGPESAGGLGHRYGRRLGIRRRMGPGTAAPLATAMSIVMAAALVGLAAAAALSGRPGIPGYVTGAPVQDGDDIFTRVDEVPIGWRASDDATWDLYLAAVAPDRFGQPPPIGTLDVEGLAEVVLHAWPRVDGRTPLGLLVLVGLLVVGMATWVVADARRQRLLLGVAAAGVTVALVTLVVILVGGTWLARSTGAASILRFIVIVPVAAALVVLWLLQRRLDPSRRPYLPARVARTIAVVAPFVVAAAIAAPFAGSPDPRRPAPVSATGIEAYAWIDGNLPSDARILVGAHTPGTLAVLADRVGIVDGPTLAPELGTWPIEPTALLLGARRMLSDPDGSGAASYIEREGVDYALVTGPGGTASDLGGYAPFAVDIAALGTSPRFREVRRFGDGRLVLFQVTLP